MTDPTHEPTPAPTPAPTEGATIVERGDRSEGTEVSKSQAMERMAKAVQDANEVVLKSMLQAIEASESPQPMSPADIYLSVLLRMVELPFLYDDRGDFDDERADGTARKIVKMYRDFTA